MHTLSLKTRVLVMFRYLQVNINMHVVAGVQLMCTLFPLSLRIKLLLSEQSDGAKSCLARLLNSVVMATETSWQLECISFENKTSTKHYASTRAASLLLMDINIYMVWKIFSQWRRVGGLWRAETWTDEVVCVRHLCLCAHVWMHKYISQHLLNLTHRNNNAGF